MDTRRVSFLHVSWGYLSIRPSVFLTKTTLVESERFRTLLTMALKQDFWGQPCMRTALASGTPSTLEKVERDVTFRREATVTDSSHKDSEAP